MYAKTTGKDTAATTAIATAAVAVATAMNHTVNIVDIGRKKPH